MNQLPARMKYIDIYKPESYILSKAFNSLKSFAKLINGVYVSALTTKK